LRDVKLYEDAKKEYDTLNQTQPTLQCAKNGLKNVTKKLEDAEKFFKQGQELENKKDYHQALRKYIEALKVYPTSKKYIDKIFEDKFTPVRKLVDGGFYVEARKKLSEIIENDPSSEIPSDLQYLSGRVYPFQAELQNFREIWLLPILDYLILFVIAIIIINILVRLINNFCKQRFYLDVKDFNDEATALKIGKGTTAMVKKSLIKSGELGEKPMVNIAFEPIGKFEPPIDLKQIAFPLDILSKLVNWLLPVQSYTLSGYCQESKQGVGLTLVLKSSDETVFSETFWQKDYDPDIKISEVADICQLLAEPATIWIIFKLNSDAANKWLDFNSWESYAYCKIGGYWSLKSDYSQAEKMLQKSLLHCQNNRFALFNLGVIRIQQAAELNDQGILRQSETMLTRAKEEAEKWKEDKGNSKYLYKDAVWYKAMYQLAAIEEYNHIMFQQQLPTTNDLKAKQLVQSIKLITDCKDFSDDKTLKIFLQEFRPMAQILYASILVRYPARGEEDPAQQEIDNLNSNYYIDLIENVIENMLNNQRQGSSEQKSVLPYRAYYNLACYHAAKAEKSNPQQQQPNNDDNKKLFDYLRYALKQDKTLAKWAKYDPSFKWIREQNDLSFHFYRILDEILYP
jgi:hypothetical protein